MFKKFSEVRRDQLAGCIMDVKGVSQVIELKMTSQAFHELPGGPEMPQWHVEIQISFVQLLSQTEQMAQRVKPRGGAVCRAIIIRRVYRGFMTPPSRYLVAAI